MRLGWNVILAVRFISIKVNVHKGNDEKRISVCWHRLQHLVELTKGSSKSRGPTKQKKVIRVGTQESASLSTNVKIDEM
jgi:hypothetical protein